MQQAHRWRVLAWVLGALAVPACLPATPVVPVRTRPLQAATRAAYPVALDVFLAWDNELDWGRSLSKAVVDAAVASRNVAATVLYDGSMTNPNLLYTGQPQRSSDVQAVPEPDTGSAAGLEAFLTRARQDAPAQRRVLALQDHGGGVLRGICIDEDHYDKPRVIHIEPLAEVLARHPVDVLFLDACYMNMAEVSFALRQGAKVVIGGQNILHGRFPYVELMARLEAAPQGELTGLARTLLSEIDRHAEYESVAFGAVHAERSELLAAAVTKLVQVLRTQPAETKAAALAAIGKAQPYAENDAPNLKIYNSYRDFGGVMTELAKLPQPEVRQAAQAALAAQQQVVLAQAVHPGDGLSAATTSGLSLYAPSGTTVDARYLTTAWNKATGWGDLLAELNGKASRGPGVVVDSYPFAFPARR